MSNPYHDLCQWRDDMIDLFWEDYPIMQAMKTRRNP